MLRISLLLIALCLHLPCTSFAGEPKKIINQMVINADIDQQAIEMTDGMLVSLGSRKTIATESRQDLKKIMALVAALVKSGDIAMAEIVMAESGKQPADSAWPYLLKLVNEASLPSEEDEQYQKVYQVYQKQVSKYKNWPDKYRFYATVMMKSAIFSDDKAWDFGSKIFSEKPDNLKALSLSRSLIQRTVKQVY